MWLKSRFTCTFTHTCCSTPEVPSTYIHSFPSLEPPKNIILLIRERIAKNISIFPLWNKCSSYLVTTTRYIISRDECSKKKRYEEIKRGKRPKPRKKRKSETRGKNGQVSDSRIRGTRYPPERKEKEKREHLILLKSFKKQGRYVPPQKSKSRLSPLLSPSSPYIIHSPHMHILIWLIDLFLWIHGLTMQ